MVNFEKFKQMDKGNLSGAVGGRLALHAEQAMLIQTLALGWI
jgi:hypothetical protein